MIFHFNFESAEYFSEIKKTLILFRPIKSKLFRICNFLPELKNNKEFIQVCNTLSVNKKPTQGTYFFKVESMNDFEDISNIFNYMGIEHVFAELDIAPIIQEKKQFLN